MKKTFVLALTALTTFGSIAMADVIMPNTTVIEGESATTLINNIVQVTGQKPGSFHGRDMVSAKANVICTSTQGAQAACKIEIEK